MHFSDIHMHLLYDTDDGARTRNDMFAMVDAAYKSGTRFICATPHFYPAFFGDNRESSLNAFEVLTEYCSEKYPDLVLMLGNELYYKHDSVSWLKNNLCRTMGNTNYILVEFTVTDSEDQITEGIYRIQNMGYTPIIAHAERYKNLSAGRIWSFRQNGVLIQVNSESVPKAKSFGCNRRVRELLSEGYVDFISTDAHNLTARPPLMDKCYEKFVAKYGKEYSDALFRDNALKLLLGENR